VRANGPVSTARTDDPSAGRELHVFRRASTTIKRRVARVRQSEGLEAPRRRLDDRRDGQDIEEQFKEAIKDRRFGG